MMFACSLLNGAQDCFSSPFFVATIGTGKYVDRMDTQITLFGCEFVFPGTDITNSRAPEVEVGMAIDIVLF